MVVLYDKSGIDFEPAGAAYSYGSEVCRLDHFLRPDFRWWCDYLHYGPRFHRKLWEWAYICAALRERGMLAPGKKGLGFGVGGEPLADAFASFGAEVVGTDQSVATAGEQGWRREDEFASALSDLARHGISSPEKFAQRVRYETADMNNIGAHLTGLDFCWSSCALEHLGSLQHGVDFIWHSLDTLKPGGVGVHTTEFNLSSDSETIESPTLSVYRRKDIIELAARLRESGHDVAPLNFWSGDHAFERHVDLPPYCDDLHLRLQIDRFSVSSIGLIITKGD